MSIKKYTLPARQAGPAPGGARLLYVAQAQYGEGWDATPHTHACAELFFITGGSGAFHVRQDTIPVSVNDLLVVNTGVPHAADSRNEDPLEYTVLGVSGLETVADIGGCALIHLPDGREDGKTCLRMIEEELQNVRPGYESVCQHLLGVMLVRLLRRADFTLANAPAGARVNQECDQVRRYIDNHFKENLNLDQLAALVHINKYYLVHAFRKEFNTSPISYLITRRIQESRILLVETDQTLSKIAQSLGFSSLSYFSQSFRKVEGISPMEYRKKHRRPRAAKP